MLSNPEKCIVSQKRYTDALLACLGEPMEARGGTEISQKKCLSGVRGTCLSLLYRLLHLLTARFS